MKDRVGKTARWSAHWARQMRTCRLSRCCIGLFIGLAGLAVRAAEADGVRHAECLAAVVPEMATDPNLRAQSLRAMAAMRDRCLDVPAFLAVLGGRYLDAGEPQEALIWLERALLLDPDSLGAQADLALALAALGNPEPLEALLASWRLRIDIPPTLLKRMTDVADPAQRYRLPVVALGAAATDPVPKPWQVEVSLLAGYESNLDRSPRLSELTITIPGGELVVPLEDQDRHGGAVQSSVAFQWHQALASGWRLRVASAAATRHAPRHSGTDWRQAQAVASVTHQVGPWRNQFELLGIWVAGPLGEPFRQLRRTFQLERELLACRARLAAEDETRRHRESGSLDAIYRGFVYGVQCGISPSWAAGVLWRRGVDDDINDQRPGGRQHLRSVVGVLQGRLMQDSRLEVSWRVSEARDSEGYSELLNGGAVRRLRHQQWTIEWAWPLPTRGTEWLAQWQQSQQKSNLSLFSYSAQTFYTGIRAQW